MLATFISPPECLLHDTGAVHPECAERLRVIQDQLLTSGLASLVHWVDAPEAALEDILRVHPQTYLDSIDAALPNTGAHLFNEEVTLSAQSLSAARAGAGAVIEAVRIVNSGKSDAIFCAVRPPGHHANRDNAMGFCLFNNAVIGARYALDVAGFARVAICDFDVHHGNGTQDLVAGDARLLLCSSFQHPLYPNTPVDDIAPNIINTKLDKGTRSEAFRTAITRDWLPALDQFKPDLIIISAGFDGFIDDDMAQLALVEQDYFWLGNLLREYLTASQNLAPAQQCKGLIATLEGGYDLPSLGRCVVAHIKGLACL